MIIFIPLLALQIECANDSVGNAIYREKQQSQYKCPLCLKHTGCRKKRTGTLEEQVAGSLVRGTGIGNADVIEEAAELLTLAERSGGIDELSEGAEGLAADARICEGGDAKHTGKVTVDTLSV